jgi:hypothetical protein
VAKILKGELSELNIIVENIRIVEMLRDKREEKEYIIE